MFFVSVAVVWGSRQRGSGGRPASLRYREYSSAAANLPKLLPEVRARQDPAKFVFARRGSLLLLLYSVKEEVRGAPAGAENIMKVTKVIQNWTSGLHGVGTYHGAGPAMTQKIMLSKLVGYDKEVELVKKALNIKD